MQEYKQSNTRLKAIINKGGTLCNGFQVYFDLLNDKQNTRLCGIKILQISKYPKQPLNYK
jgi:hypothetical protein